MTSRIQSLPQGTTLYRPGQECPGFVVVHSGTIRVSLTAENGREITLYRVRPGEVCLQTFGCLVNHQPYSAESVAESDVAIEILPPTEFYRRVTTDEGFRTQLFSAVAARFSDMERLVEDVALSGLEARLARSLLRLRDAQDTVTTTHEALAMEIGSGRAAVSRALGAFARRGLVDIGRGATHIVDVPALERLAHEDR